MSERRLFLCIDCEQECYPVDLSDEDADSYDDEVDSASYNSDYELSVPEVSSFNIWLSENEHLQNLHHACPGCGRDDGLSWSDKD